MKKRIALFMLFFLGSAFVQAQGGYSFTVITNGKELRYTITSINPRTVTVSASSTSLSGSISIPSTVSSTGSGLPTSYIGNYSVTRLGSFAGCTQITSVSMPSSITAMNNYAFNGCSSLHSVSLSSNITASLECRRLACNFNINRQ